MTPETLRWLHWLVTQQSVNVGAPDALQQVAAARQALQEIEQALNDQAVVEEPVD